MRFLALVVAVALQLPARAEGPEDQYVVAYDLIEQADQMQRTGNAAAAAEKYSLAEKSLRAIRSKYPDWNEGLVAFRLKYIAESLRSEPAQNSRTSPEIAAWMEEVRRLREENSNLVSRLKEALSLQPARLGPEPLARAEEKIVLLEKERDLLKISLDQARASAASAKKTDPSESATSRRVKQLERESETLRKRLDATIKELADAEAQRDDLQLNQLNRIKRERDELEKALDVAIKELRRLKQGKLNLFPRQSPQDLANELQPAIFLPASRGARAATLMPVLNQDAPVTPPAQPAGPNTAKNPARTYKDLSADARAGSEEAERLFSSRRFNEAEFQWQQLLMGDEKNVYLLVHLAASQIELGKLEEAEKTLTRSLAIDADDAAALTLKGILKLKQNRTDEALELLKRAVGLNGKNASTQNYLGIAFTEKGRYREAETALRKALELQPDYGLAHNNLAVVYASQKPASVELARYHYQKAQLLGEDKNPALEKMLGGDEKEKSPPAGKTE